MSAICKTYNTYTHQLQSYLDSRIPGFPKGFVNSCALSFAVGATASVILSGGNPVMGLLGGSLSVVACAVNVCVKDALQSLQDKYTTKNENGIRPLNRTARVLADVASFTGCLIGFHAVGLPVNIGGSLLITLPFYYLANRGTLSTQ